MITGKSVFAIYMSRSVVDTAVNALKDAGFSNSTISILLPENVSTSELATERSTKLQKAQPLV